MVMVSELALLDLKDALKLALVQSGKTPLEVAREMGWSAHHAKQVFGLNDYIPRRGLFRPCAAFWETAFFRTGLWQASTRFRRAVMKSDVMSL